MAHEEGIQAEPEALTLIARQSTGALRDAISLLDQLASTGQTITLEMAQDVLGTAASQAVLDLIDALIEQQIRRRAGSASMLPWTPAPTRASSPARSSITCATCC